MRPLQLLLRDVEAHAFYNDSDAFVCDWLRNLEGCGHIAPGAVDQRSITELRADDLRGFLQCHFFAGIGGWSYALRLAGWPDDRPVWTGSCPCQPFSGAGAQRGSDDVRHLWPAWFRLIRQCAPSTIFGEQVARANGYAWIDHVFADLESVGYAVAAADMPSCAIGAPHERQRLWFVAYRDGATGVTPTRLHEDGSRWNDAAGCSAHDADRMDNAKRTRLEGFAGNVGHRDGRKKAHRSTAATSASDPPWRELEWLPCVDGKARPTKPGLFPVADGLPGRVGRLRAYGNAIVPQLAAHFIAAVMDIIE